MIDRSGFWGWFATVCGGVGVGVGRNAPLEVVEFVDEEFEVLDVVETCTWIGVVCAVVDEITGRLVAIDVTATDKVAAVDETVAVFVDVDEGFTVTTVLGSGVRLGSNGKE